MITIPLYKKSNEIYQLEFLEHNNIETLIICPGPVVADHLRAKFSTNTQDVSVITMSKFLGEEFNKGFQIEKDKIKTRTELLLFLSTVWKQKFSDASEFMFLNAYDAFTDLRSYTPHVNLVEEVLHHFDPVIEDAVRLFWQITDKMEIVDEHKKYFLLSEAYRSLDNPIHTLKKRNLIFIGFNYLSAVQVDMIKSLAIRDDVFIPYSKWVYSKTSSEDWIRWFDEMEVSNDEEITFSPLITRFSKGSLNRVLRQDCLDSKRKNVIYLMEKNPEYGECSEIALPNTFYRAPASIFEATMKEEFSLLSSKVKHEGELKVEDFAKVVGDKITEFASPPFKNTKALKLKVYQLLQKVLIAWRELSDANIFVDVFWLKVFREIVHLDLPRGFFQPISQNEKKVEVKGIEGLEACSEDDFSIVVGSSHYSPVKNTSNPYPEEVLKFLLTIGPVPRKELEYQTLKFRLLEMLGTGATHLYLETGIEEHDFFWKELLEHLDRAQEKGISSSKNKKEQDVLKGFLGKTATEITLSPSKVQTFLDCPRKFYFQYLYPFSLNPITEDSFSPLEFGNLEHKVIEDYMTAGENWDAKRHRNTVLKILKAYSVKASKQFQRSEEEKILSELLIYSENGIQALLKIKDELNVEKFHFEIPLKEREGYSGRIDCMLEFKDGVGVLDFKRGKGSIPSKKDFVGFNKIQVWSYINNLPSEKEVLFAGYLPLAEVAESRVFFREKGSYDLPFRTPELNFSEFLPRYKEFEEKIIMRIKAEKKFLAIPMNEKSCGFCPVENYCMKKEEVSCH